MTTTQIDVNLFLGSRQLASCSFFVPVPAIVHKSQQQLESILPYLPISHIPFIRGKVHPPQPIPSTTELPSCSAVLSNSPTCADLIPPSPTDLVQQQQKKQPPASSLSSSSQLTLSSASSATWTAVSTPFEEQVDPFLLKSSESSGILLKSYFPPPTSRSQNLFPGSTVSCTSLSRQSLHRTKKNGGLPPPHPTVNTALPLRSQYISNNNNSNNRNSNSYSTKSGSLQSLPSPPPPYQIHPQSSIRPTSTLAAIDNNKPAPTSSYQISLKPQPGLNFLGLCFSRNTNSTHPTIKNNNKMSPPRLTPVLFTFPFPPYDQGFPSSVQVTGTFDDWQRTSPCLTKNEQEGRFEGEIQVDLERLYDHYLEGVPGQEERPFQKRMLFKFVLDGHQWVTDSSQSLERDYEGNLNNVRILENMTSEEVAVKTGASKTASTEAALVPEDSAKAVEESVPPADKVEDAWSPEEAIAAAMAFSAKTQTLAGESLPVQQDTSSVATTPETTSTTHQKTPLSSADQHEDDGDYGEIVLQGEPVTLKTSPSTTTPSTNGDASPTIDSSITIPATAPTTTTTKLNISTSTDSITSTTCDSSASTPLTDNSSMTDLTTPSASASTASLSPVTKPRVSTERVAQTAKAAKATVKPKSPKHLYAPTSSALNSTAKVSNPMSAAPTTAISTSTPTFPSNPSIAPSKASKRKSGFWKKVKKVLN